ncbi:hypothetical protein [Nocardia sp. NBC_01327]|uniref:hypothetical protein n=1 Tax=Nocardia sp. NBC_01327 TaxID=2903593 RepID=UPI002E0E6E38|nr:hypothetical protein OG326_26065 [Nocardia sp. NBC_01327]
MTGAGGRRAAALLTTSARILLTVGRLSGMIDPASTQTGVAEFCDAFAAWEAESCPDHT